MRDTSIVEPAGIDTCRVVLLHDYRAVCDDPESPAWIDRAVVRNSRAELASLEANPAAATDSAELLSPSPTPFASVR